MRRPLLLCLAGLLLAAGLPGSRATPSAPSVTLRHAPDLSPGVRRALAGLPPGVRVGLLVGDLTTGERLEARGADLPLIPASTLKLVMAASVLVDRGGAGWWSTELTVPAAEVGRARVSHLTLRGGADPTLSVASGPNSLRSLAKQAYARGVREVGGVRLDETGLDAGTWRGLALGVPMTPLRLADWHNRPPLSAGEARARVGAALITELRRAGIRVLSGAVGTASPFRPYIPPPRSDERGRPLPPDPFVPVPRRPEQGVASVRSASPSSVLAATLRPSDNLRAEELLATLAVRPVGNGTLGGALSRERAALRRFGVDLTGVRLADGSGLSRENRLTPRALVELLGVMYHLPYPQGQPGAELPDATYRARRNAFAEALPQAGTGENVPGHGGRGGTLALRLRGSGLDVRAKTGTLPGVSALAGYVTGRSGHTLAFALLMNGPEDSPILTLREVQDRVVRAVAAAH
ncbi:peptidase S13, D-Ala-D-Ala carboxypeptidase C [Deinococcus aerius]|uniref:Peptidase S13, D-Ala-D-Ala carboxypeptidase C n=1 Tax=Deinococcus aerius TaxID=200253 RepID=A0A2I9CYN1_9DEIO|nr:D-alanyl-D-alanine carboxypeptidase [Deinococcus aerius]GBF07264.1 peptidase S13, D-Ala-D-Ala carboxypeptidase C [Deinococcus aerius]